MMTESERFDPPLSARSMNCLKNLGAPFDENGLPNVKWIANNCTQKDILRLPNFGRGSLNELLDFMNDQGYTILKDEHDSTPSTPRNAAKAVRQALKNFPPQEGERLQQWLRRLEGS